VKTVASVYREAVDAWFEGKYNQENIDTWNAKLNTVYNRGFWDGYYLGKKTGEWTEEYGNQATQRKMLIGTVTNYFSKIQVAEIKISAHSLKVGEDVLIIGPTTGVYEDKVKELRLELEPIEQVKKGDLFSMPVSEIVRRNDNVYKLVPADKKVPNLVQQ
jgi:putative protease